MLNVQWNKIRHESWFFNKAQKNIISRGCSLKCVLVVTVKLEDSIFPFARLIYAIATVYFLSLIATKTARSKMYLTLTSWLWRHWYSCYPLIHKRCNDRKKVKFRLLSKHVVIVCWEVVNTLWSYSAKSYN